jgi:hypothetical protein
MNIKRRIIDSCKDCLEKKGTSKLDIGIIA